MTNRNKYLTEAMGECWHEFKSGDKAAWPSCINCGEGGEDSDSYGYNTDFSTWQGFGKLKDYISTTDHRHEFWGFYIDVLYNRGDTVSDTMDVITPDSLANNYYEFLKGR